MRTVCFVGSWLALVLFLSPQLCCSLENQQPCNHSRCESQQPYSQQSGTLGFEFLKKLKIELPYDPVIPLIGIYPKELKSGSQRDICTHISIVALFLIAKMWKQAKCPLIDEWIKKIWSIYTVEYCSALKKEGNPMKLWQHGWTWETLCLGKCQAQKDMHLIILRLWSIWSNQIHRIKEWNGGC